jgi:hypothetical protein
MDEDQWLKTLNCKYMGWRVRGRLRRCQNENFEACTENKLPNEWLRLLMLLLLLLSSSPICKVDKCCKSTDYYKWSVLIYNYYRALKKCLSMWHVSRITDFYIDNESSSVLTSSTWLVRLWGIMPEVEMVSDYGPVSVATFTWVF